MTRLAAFAVIFAALGGAGAALLGDSVHDAVSYGIALLTGAFFGFGLAKR